MHHPTDRITHTTAFVTPVVEHWLEREIAQWVHPMKDRSDDPSHHERMLYLWATSCSSPTWSQSTSVNKLCKSSLLLSLNHKVIFTVLLVFLDLDFYYIYLTLNSKQYNYCHQHQKYGDWSHTDCTSGGRKKMFYLTTHLTHFIYG